MPFVSISCKLIYQTVADVGTQWGLSLLCEVEGQVTGAGGLAYLSEKMGLEEAGDLREFCVCLQYEEADKI